MAAKLYDIIMVQNKGLSARLNFSYTKAELLAILCNGSILELRSNKRGDQIVRSGRKIKRVKRWPPTENNEPVDEIEESDDEIGEPTAEIKEMTIDIKEPTDDI